MKTTQHTTAQTAQIGTIDKVLFALFFTFYVAAIVFASAALTGCAPTDQMVIGTPLEEEVSADSKQDAGGLKGATNVTGRSGNGNTTDSISSRNVTDSGNDATSSASDTKGGTRTVSDLNSGSSNGGSVNDDGSNGNYSDSGDDTDTADDTSIGIDGKIVAGVQDMSSSDMKASVIQDTTVSTTADSNGGRAKDTSSTIQDASTVKDTTSSTVLDTKGTVIADIGTSSDTDVGIGQKPDIITITQDVMTTVKDTVTDIIKDTSAGIILDIIASADNGGQKIDSKGQFDIGGASASDTSAAPDSQIVKDTSAVQDAQIWYDTQIAKDAQSAKDAQAQQDTQNQQDTQIQPTPDVFIAPNNQTTWYTSKEYKYKVQYPSWVQATVLKTTDLQLTGNVLNKVGLTDEKLLGVGHFTLRTEFEYHPEYAAPYDEWWKYLYGKPDETATYQGQTLKFQSIDGGAGFNRFTHVKIGKVGALRIEMSFYMPPHLYVEGFEQKALEVLYMVTKSAQAVN